MTKVNSKEVKNASEQIDYYISDLTDWRGKILKKIRKVFHEAETNIIAEWKWMGSPAWSCNELIAVANAHKKKVKVTFNQGAHIDDEHKRFNAGLGGKKWRAIDLFEEDEINESALKNLKQSAISFNRINKMITSV